MSDAKIDVASFTDANELMRATCWTREQAREKVKEEIAKTMKAIKQSK